MLELFEQEAEERQREAGEQRIDSKDPETGKFQVGAEMRQAGDEPKERAPQSRDKAARASGSSPAAVQQAKRVQDSGVPELQAAVAEGRIKVSEADKRPDRGLSNCKNTRLPGNNAFGALQRVGEQQEEASLGNRCAGKCSTPV